MMTDPISDLLTRLRNGFHAKKELVEVPFSNLKLEILNILKKEGYIQSFTVSEEGNLKKILVVLRYNAKKEPIIHELKRVSKPGRRIYLKCAQIKPVLNGMGVAIVSTSRGLITDAQAREAKIGGELLCTVW